MPSITIDLKDGTTPTTVETSDFFLFTAEDGGLVERGHVTDDSHIVLSFIVAMENMCGRLMKQIGATRGLIDNLKRQLANRTTKGQ